MDYAIRPNAKPVQFSIWALTLLTFNMALLFAAGRVPDFALGGFGKMLKAYLVLFTIYGWRFCLMQGQLPNKRKLVGVLSIFLLCLPYILLCIEPMFPAGKVLAAAKWIGLPIWLYTVPFCSFLLFDLNPHVCPQRTYVTRSVMETVVFFHLWMYAWAFLQWHIGWGQF